MKKLLLVLLLLTLCLPAVAEDVTAGPYLLTLPEGATLETGEGSWVIVRGGTRVVAMVHDRVADEDVQAALLRLMTQFDPQAVYGEELPLREGCAGMMGRSADSLAQGVDRITAMVLCRGDLLILSGYDLAGDGAAVEALIAELLALSTVDGAPLLTPDAAY